MPELIIRTCPKCGEDRLVLGRGVRQKVGGIPVQVCDVCSLPGIKQSVTSKSAKVRRQLARYAFLDLSGIQRKVDDAEGHLEDAEESLPDKWEEVAGDLVMAQRLIRQADKDIDVVVANALVTETEKNLAKAGEVQVSESDDAERVDKHGELDEQKRIAEKAIALAQKSLEDSELTSLNFDDQRSLRLLAKDQAAEAYVRSKNYLEGKVEVDVSKAVEELLGGPEEEEVPPPEGEETTDETPSAEEAAVEPEQVAEQVIEEEVDQEG